MTPAARLAAAIEIVDLILAAAVEGGAAADTVAARYFRDRRYAGSGDRRAIREVVYAAVRRAGERPESGRAALIGLAGERPDIMALFDGSVRAPAAILPEEAVAPAGIAPAWLEAALADAIGRDELPALLERAPLDLRVNRLRATRAEVLAAVPGAQPGRLAGDALRLPKGSRVERIAAWHDGLFEVQDEGSQLVAVACGAGPGQLVVDLCAGGGGKTLALAAAMRNRGRLVACDTDRSRLRRLAPRAERAGASGIETRLLDPGREAAALADLAGMADVVLVDAPCSGTGTWRRNPESRWRITPERLDRLVALQAHVLALGAGLVRPGGTLVYAVCSLLPAEGPDRATALVGQGGWEPLPLGFGRPAGAGRLLTPARDGTDGFFVASLARRC